MSTDSPERAAAISTEQLPLDVRELYPFDARWLQVAGGRMHYVDESPRDLPAADNVAQTLAAPLPQGSAGSLASIATEAAGVPSGKSSAPAGSQAAIAAEAAGEAVATAGEPLPPVLLLHGNPTWSFFYRDVILKLVIEGRRCIAPDHIGCGLSDKPQTGFGYTLEENISNVIALIEHLGLKTFDLVVHDWGGAIGMGVATRMPQRVRRIVILNTAAFRSKDIPLRIALCRVPLLGELIVRGLNGFAWPATFMAVSRKPLGQTQKRGFLFPYGNWRDRIATHRFVKAIPLREGDENYNTLAAIEDKLHLLNKKPKLLLWGGRDFCFNDRFYQRWLEIFPDVRQRYISDAGHYLLEDAPRETISEITTFLQQP